MADRVALSSGDAVKLSDAVFSDPAHIIQSYLLSSELSVRRCLDLLQLPPSNLPTLSMFDSQETLDIRSFVDDRTDPDHRLVYEHRVEALTEHIFPDPPPIPNIPSATPSLSASRPTLVGQLSQKPSAAPLPKVLLQESEKPPRKLGLSKRRRLTYLTLGVAGVVIFMAFLAAFLPVYFTVIKKPSSSVASGIASSSSSSTSTHSAFPTSTGAPKSTTGGDGSVITLSDGTNFTYRNPFGGYCASFFRNLSGGSHVLTLSMP